MLRTALVGLVLLHFTVVPVLAQGNPNPSGPRWDPHRMSELWMERMERSRVHQANPLETPWVPVRVKAANVAGQKITFSHGAFESIDMPAMTMTFPVADPIHLNMLKRGDRIEVQVAEIAGTPKIINFRMRH